MSKKSHRTQTARETLAILQTGVYTNDNNNEVAIQVPLARAVSHSVLYRPESFADVFASRARLLAETGAATAFEVTNETTLHAAARLLGQGADNVLALNFASAKNPGGGFLNGAQAQEESLARASGLYLTLGHHWELYEVNRRTESCLYTDHLIYSPNVPVFRDDDDQLLDQPYPVSFITAPAVNAGVVHQRGDATEIARIDEVMRSRAEKVLSVAAIQHHRTLVLGAWGCGVFRNNPAHVAGYFHQLLVNNPAFGGLFGRVVFAVLDHSPAESNLRSFRELFA